MTERFDTPDSGIGGVEEAAVPYHGEGSPPSSGIMLAKDRNEARLLAISGVTGVGIGRNAIGDDAIVVYLLDRSVASRVPAEVDGYPVEPVVTGPIDAQRLGRP